MARNILKLNNWLITLIIICILIGFQIWSDQYSSYDATTVVMSIYSSSANLDRVILYILSSTYLGLLFSYIYSYISSVNIYKLMSENLREEINILAFKRLIITSFAIVFLFPSIMLFIYYVLFTNGFTNLIAAFVRLILLLIILGTMISTANFSAKILVSYELNKLASIKEYYRTLILYFIFPLGLPFMHNRVKNIIEK